MKPFKIRIDWTCHHHYGDPVEVELHVMDAEPRTLQTFPTIPRAVDYVVRWFTGRGLGYWCNVDWHQREGHTHITLHPRPSPGPWFGSLPSDLSDGRWES